MPETICRNYPRSKELLPLEEMTLRQLRRVASEFNVSRYSRMRKAKLLAEVKKSVVTSRPPLINAGREQPMEAQPVEAATFERPQKDVADEILLASVDEELGDLPKGYEESRIVLMPREPQWAYAYWDIAKEDQEKLLRLGGQQLALRLYDVTDMNSPHHVQEYLCGELALEWYLPIPVSDRDYMVEIGYRCRDDRWLILAGSTPVRIPPVYPSEWVEETFITVHWEEDLQGETVHELVQPSRSNRNKGNGSSIYDEIFKQAQSRVAGSLFGSMQQVPVAKPALDSSILAGMWAFSPDVNLSAADETISILPFWLVGDTELMVKGATDPDSTVGGNQIELNADGTFRKTN